MSLIWFTAIHPVANVNAKPAELEAINRVLKEIISWLDKRFKGDEAEPHNTAFHQSCSYNQSYGGIQYILRLEENMVVSACDFYLELCMNSRNIKKLHIIAGESGAYLAMRAFSFFVKYGERFQYNSDMFDHKLLGNMILVCPSLPSPSGLAKLLWQMIRPPFYNHKQLQTEERVVVVEINKPIAHLELVTITGPKVTTVNQSGVKDMLKEMFPPIIHTVNGNAKGPQ